MDFLKEYGSSVSNSTDNEDDISRDSAEGLSSNLNDRAVRQVYLITKSFNLMYKLNKTIKRKSRSVQGALPR